MRILLATALFLALFFIEANRVRWEVIWKEDAFWRKWPSFTEGSGISTHEHGIGWDFPIIVNPYVPEGTIFFVSGGLYLNEPELTMLKNFVDEQEDV